MCSSLKGIRSLKALKTEPPALHFSPKVRDEMQDSHKKKEAKNMFLAKCKCESQVLTPMAQCGKTRTRATQTLRQPTGSLQRGGVSGPTWCNTHHFVMNTSESLLITFYSSSLWDICFSDYINSCRNKVYTRCSPTIVSSSMKEGQIFM